MSTALPTRRVNRGTSHWYYLDGDKVDGVTTVIGNGLPKPALINWSANVTAEYVMDRLTIDGDRVVADQLVDDLRTFNSTRRTPERLGDGLPRLGLAKLLAQVRYISSGEAAAKGTEVHGLAERLGRGEEVDVPEHLIGHVDSYLAFRRDWEPTEEILEFVAINRKHRYMGTGDLIARLNVPCPLCGGEGCRWLLDHKTGKGVYDDTALQLVSYRNAETIIDPADPANELPMPAIDHCGVIWLRADGYDLIPFQCGPDEFRTFLYVQQVARFGQRDDLKGDALRPAAVAS